VSWETRTGKGRYYTRNRREGGRFVREYLGTGEYGEYFAALDAQARAERIERADAERAAIADLTDLDQRVAVYATSVKAAAHEALVAAGYKRHQRGEWRKTRGQA
jgi:hypothetical protein